MWWDKLPRGTLGGEVGRRAIWMAAGDSCWDQKSWNLILDLLDGRWERKGRRRRGGWRVFLCLYCSAQGSENRLIVRKPCITAGSHRIPPPKYASHHQKPQRRPRRGSDWHCYGFGAKRRKNKLHKQNPPIATPKWQLRKDSIKDCL